MEGWGSEGLNGHGDRGELEAEESASPIFSEL